MLPREIRTENWPDRATYDLPMRPLGGARWVGLLPMAFGLLFVGMPARFMWRSALGALQHNANVLNWVPVVFLSVFVIVGMMPFCLGLFILAGRVRLVVTRERLIITQVAGPIRWSRKLQLADITGLEASKRSEQDEPLPPQVEGLARLGALVARMRNGPKRLVALGYPSEWLRGLADELSQVMRRWGAAVPVEEIAKSFGSLVELEKEEEEEEEQNSAPPAGSTARLVTTVGGVEITVPSRGLMKDSAGMIWFSMFWCGLLGAISFAIVFGHSSARHVDGSAILVVSLFWIIGLGMLALGIHLGTRCWTVHADKASLRVGLRSALRKREWQWSAAEIQKIQAGNSNTEVNDRPLQELQVISRAGKKTGLLLGREREELVWLASRLRKALGLNRETNVVAEVARL